MEGTGRILHTQNQRKDKAPWVCSNPRVHAHRWQPPTPKDKGKLLRHFIAFPPHWAGIAWVLWFYCSCSYVHLICLHTSLHVLGTAFSFPLLFFFLIVFLSLWFLFAFNMLSSVLILSHWLLKIHIFILLLTFTNSGFELLQYFKIFPFSLFLHLCPSPPNSILHFHSFSCINLALFLL